MEIDLPDAPQSEFETDSRKRHFWGRAIVVAISVIVIAPLVGVSGTIIGMIQSFQAIGPSESIDQEALAQSVSKSLLATAIGLVISTIGLLILIIALIRYFTLRDQPVPTSGS